METIVSRQEFIRYTSKYMKKMPVIITNRGEKDLILDEYRHPVVNVSGVAEFSLVYGCGCKVIDGKKLCPKHNRT